MFPTLQYVLVLLWLWTVHFFPSAAHSKLPIPLSVVLAVICSAPLSSKLIHIWLCIGYNCRVTWTTFLLRPTINEFHLPPPLKRTGESLLPLLITCPWWRRHVKQIPNSFLLPPAFCLYGRRFQLGTSYANWCNCFFFMLVSFFLRWMGLGCQLHLQLHAWFDHAYIIIQQAASRGLRLFTWHFVVRFSV